jgi:predicted metal-binding membrane protein
MTITPAPTLAGADRSGESRRGGRAVSWLGRPNHVAITAILVLTLAGWAALMVEASRGGLTSEALLRAICRPAALSTRITLGEWLGTLAVSTALWSAMGLAMMLPTAAPMVLTYAEKAESAARAGWRPASPLVVVAGYAGVWLGVAVGAALLQSASAFVWPWLNLPQRATTIMAGAAIGAAGLYQFSEAKAACLSFCRHPFPTLDPCDTQNRFTVFRLGLAQGVACLGCCWALMALMLLAGAMNLFWMAVLSLLMTIEKLTASAGVPRAIGLGLVMAGLAVAFGAVGLDSVARWLTSP